MPASAATVLDALGDKNRRSILEKLADGPIAVGVLADQLPISRPAVSQHLRVLCDAGLLSVRRSGRNSFYRTREDRIDRLRAYLDTFWGDRLAALKRAAEREAQR